MFTMCEMFILIPSLTLFAANSANSKIIFSSRATDEDIKSLTPIQPNEALPIILYKNAKEELLPGLFPAFLPEIEEKNGRIWASPHTGFLSVPLKKPVFFCPNPDSSQQCLVPRKFEQPQALQCEREPMPVIDESSKGTKCGVGGRGTLLKFQYNICESIPSLKNTIKNICTYSFCYDRLLKRNLYVHYQIQSPKLLFEPLLVQERGIKFGDLNTETYDGKIDLDYRLWLSTQIESKPQYKVQMLASPKHMAFYAWKKTTNHFINVALQHEKLFDLWNEINHYIAAEAAAMSSSPRNVMTEVIEIPRKELPTRMEKNQIYNIWVTIVAEGKPASLTAIVILMNNFIDTTQTDDQIDETKTLYIDKLCEKNLCEKTLIRKFTDVGGQVRCCTLTKTLHLQFHISGIGLPKNVLQIPNINATV